MKGSPRHRSYGMFHISAPCQKSKTMTGVHFIVKYQGKPQEHLFFITNIGEDDVILGYPFFKVAMLYTNWKMGELTGEVQALEKGNENCSIWLAKTTTATQLAIQVPKEKKTWDQLVPLKYHVYGKVFQEEVLEWFPERRHWDHAIDLKPDAPTSLDCHIYPLNLAEKLAQKDFITTNLRLGWIWQSKSPYACGFFFVSKKVKRMVN